MAQNTGQSRGSRKNKQFIQDSSNSYIVDAFQDVSEVAPGSPVDGEGYIVENVGSIDPSWGTITGLADNDIIRWRQSKLEWQIVMKAVVTNQGFKAFVKDEDTLYVVDAGAEWIVASGSGGGVKNFAQKQASAYKPGDWIQGNSGIFGAAGTLAGLLDRETVAPLDGKKSFKYTTAAGSGDDWFYLLVDISEYARGGVLAFTFDYQWDGDEDIRVNIWDPTFTNEYSTELNLLKNTTNDNKLSRNSRTIYAHPDTETQVIVGFQINSAEVTGKTLIFDNVKVTDDIGVIGSSASTIDVGARVTGMTNTSHSSGVNYWLGFSTLDYDTAGIMRNVGEGSKGDSAVNGELTTHAVIPEDGLYNIKANLNWVDFDLDNEELIFIEIRVNNITKNQTPYEGKITSGSTWEWNIKVDETLNLKKNDIVEIRYDHNASGALSFTNNRTNSFSVTKVGAQVDGGRFLQVPNGEKLRNDFGVVLDTGGNIVSKSGGDWIDSISFANAGDMTINIKPGIFSVPPLVKVTHDGFERTSSFAQQVTSSSIRVRQFRTDSGVFGTGYTTLQVEATKQGLDSDSVPDIVGVPVSIQGQTHEQDSMIRLQGTNAFGATNTKVRRWDNILESYGDAVIYTDDSNLGGYFTIQRTGVYSISYTDEASGTTDVMGIVKNGVSGSSNIDSIADTDVLALEGNTPNFEATANWTGVLTAGDVIWAQSRGLGSATDKGYFTITKIGTQPLLDGGLVESPGATLRLYGSGAGGGKGSSGTQIRRFLTTVEDSLTATGDVTYIDDAVEGAKFIINEDGFYTINYNDIPVTDASHSFAGVGISRNATDLTIRCNALPAAQNLATSNIRVAGGTFFSNYGQVSWSGRLYKGDIIRPHNSSSTALNATPSQDCNFTISKHSQTTRYSSRVYKEDPIAWQQKTLSGNVSRTSSGTSQVTDLTFNNLEAGKTYRLTGTFRLQRTGNSSGNSANFNGSYPGGAMNLGYARADGLGGDLSYGSGISQIFTPSADGSLTFQLSTGISGGILYANTTYLMLEELPFHAQTSKWT